MELNKRTIKALASDTKVELLKALLERRKMPSELAKELDLAPSTIVEHLKELEALEIIEKQHTGHKWRYYALTDKGRSIIKPKIPAQIILTLSVGSILIIFSLALSFLGIPVQQFAGAEERSVAPAQQMPLGEPAIAPTPTVPVGAGSNEAAQVSDPLLMLIVIAAIIGVALVLFSLIKLMRRK